MRTIEGITTITNSKDDPEGRRGVNPETAKQGKVNSDDAKSNLHSIPHDDGAISHELIKDYFQGNPSNSVPRLQEAPVGPKKGARS